MAKMVSLTSGKANIKADATSDRSKVDYRPMYEQLRSTPSISGLTDLVESIKENSLRLREVAHKLQSI